MTSQRPTGLREVHELLDVLSAQAEGGNMAYIQEHQIAILRAALASDDGLDVERLARAMDTHYGKVPGTMRATARGVAGEYARLAGSEEAT